MRLIVAGRASEVRGFALAGVETAICDNQDEADAFLTSLAADVGLLIVSPWVAQAAAERLQTIRDRRGPPVILTLPAARADVGERP
jgi:vacuolar-type H+-ATPase subunit F/Vma7